MVGVSLFKVGGTTRNLLSDAHFTLSAGNFAITKAEINSGLGQGVFSDILLATGAFLGASEGVFACTLEVKSFFV